MRPPIELPPILRERLEGGLSAIVAQRKGVPLAAVRVVMRGGASLDPAGRFGLAHLAALVARRGTRRRTGPRIDEDVEAAGAELGAGVDEDASYFGLSAPVEALPVCLDVVADVTSEPSFPAAEVHRLRRREIAALAHDLDEPGIVADRAMTSAAFGAHPYGHAPEGRVRDLGATRRADLVSFHERNFRPSRAIVVVVGSAPAGDVLRLLRRRLGRWRAPAAPPPTLPPAPPPSGGVVLVDKPDLTQSQVRIVSAGVARASADYIPGIVASAVLGGGFTSRLNEALRVSRGLTYGVRARFSPSAAGGAFVVSTYTKNETVAELVEVTLEEIARFRERGPAEEELQRVKSYLQGLYPLSLETHEQIAERLAELELYGLGEDEIVTFGDRVDAVSGDGCREVARRYFPGERSAIVVVGPAAALAGPLARFGPVTVVPARKVI